MPATATPAASSPHIRAKMQAQRARDTKPEVALRRELHRRGMRFRTNVAFVGLPRRSADIAWTGRKLAVFVDGCYWHGCPEHFVLPKTNTQWWQDKIQRNRDRDAETSEHLERAGWTVLRVWEHEPVDKAADRVQRAWRATAPTSPATATRTATTHAMPADSVVPGPEEAVAAPPPHAGGDPAR